jgi:hypothetical protein
VARWQRNRGGRRWQQRNGRRDGRAIAISNGGDDGQQQLSQWETATAVAQSWWATTVAAQWMAGQRCNRDGKGDGNCNVNSEDESNSNGDCGGDGDGDSDGDCNGVLENIQKSRLPKMYQYIFPSYRNNSHKFQQNQLWMDKPNWEPSNELNNQANHEGIH